MGIIFQVFLVCAGVFIIGSLIVVYIQDPDFRAWVRIVNPFVRKSIIEVEISKIEETVYKDNVNSVFLLDRFHKNYDGNKNIKASIVYFKIDDFELQLLLTPRQLHGLVVGKKGTLKYYGSHFISFK